MRVEEKHCLNVYSNCINDLNVLKSILKQMEVVRLQMRWHDNEIDLIITDVDGCIIPTDPTEVDLVEMNELKKMFNKLFDAKLKRHRIVLLSGRPQPFIEAITQLYDLKTIAIAEYGGIFYDTVKNRTWYSPAITSKHRKLMWDIKNNFLESKDPLINDCLIEPGKELVITLRPPDKNILGKLQEKVNNFLENELGNEIDLITVTKSATAIDVFPRVIGKDKALDEVARVYGTTSSKVLAIGDSSADLPFLTKSRFVATVANASEDVKKIANHVSKHPHVRGMISQISSIIIESSD